MKKRTLLFVFVFLVFGISLINNVIAQADVCVEESAPLFTDSEKIYPDRQLSSGISYLSRDNMPDLLSPAGDLLYAQFIIPGFGSSFIYDKQPSSSDDPHFGMVFGTPTRTSRKS